MMEGAAMGSVRVDESDTMLEESELLDLVKKKGNVQPANPELPGEDPMARVGGLIGRSRSWSYGYRVWSASHLRQSPQPHRIYTSRNTTLEQFHLHLEAAVRTLAFSNTTACDTECITVVEAARQFAGHVYQLGEDAIHYEES